MTVRHAVARTALGTVSGCVERVPPLRERLRRGLTVFLFHDVTDAPSPFQRLTNSFTSPAVFDDQIGWIRRRFDVIHPAALLGDEALPPRAALITFDDAWAGVGRAAGPILCRHGLPSLLFLNMGTVAGGPDVAVVAAYEAAAVEERDRLLVGRSGDAEELAHAVAERYGSDASFLAFQGPTLDHDALAELPAELFGFGSHLFNHWKASDLSPLEFERSFLANERSLAEHRNHVPLLAFPFGGMHRHIRPDQVEEARRLGARRVFTAEGRQNDDASDFVLDRLYFTNETRSAQACWYRTHLERVRRVLGVGRNHPPRR